MLRNRMYDIPVRTLLQRPLWSTPLAAPLQGLEGFDPPTGETRINAAPLCDSDAL